MTLGKNLGTLLSVLLATPSAMSDVIHQVRQGETLASIAQRYYGEATREATIVAANVLSAQAGTSLLPGMRIVVPSVSYYRVEPGDTWPRIAQRELGSQTRAGYLAMVNRGSLLTLPSPGAVLRLPYLLRYVVLDDEPLFEIARRFYGDRSQVRFIMDFNHVSSARLQRGQVLLLPMPDLTLREEPKCENAAPLAAGNQVQRSIDQEIPALLSLVAHGQFIEAIALGARLAAADPLSAAQRSTIDRALAEAYCAVDRTDLAAEAFRNALTIDPSISLDPRMTPPKVLDAFNIARGLGTVRTIAPASPTARPDEAH